MIFHIINDQPVHHHVAYMNPTILYLVYRFQLLFENKILCFISFHCIINMAPPFGARNLFYLQILKMTFKFKEFISIELHINW
ncbi:hypothetical protein Hdeb2414_s0006g00212091 [Helianthus debilis subsp. tardiflorus]